LNDSPDTRHPTLAVDPAASSELREPGKEMPPLVLSWLAEGAPGLTSASGAAMAEAAAVCLADQGHGLSAPFRVAGDRSATFMLCRTAVDEQMKRSHNDEERATEDGAYGISILAVRSLTNLTVLQKSRKGTGFDYWMGPKDSFLFQGAARLEVSGIRIGDEQKIRSRVQRKLDQTRRSEGLAPALVAVVEFSRPQMRLHER
jgi:hypothetical protein